MSNDDNAFTSALWLLAGGAAGYAAGRWLVAPWFETHANAKALPRASSSGAPIARPASATWPARVATSGPSGSATPIDPYGVIDVIAVPHTGPSGDMRPIDPYADAPSATPTTVAAPLASTAPGAPSIAVSPSTSSLGVGTSTTVVDGPITMPSQLATPSGSITSPSPAVTSVATAPSRAFATKPRVRRFDPVFENYRGRLPIEYVRALVERESDGDPRARAGSAIGLMQIVPVVLADHNKRHGTAYTREHLLDPAINVAIGCELLRLIVASYGKHHPRLATLREDWANPRFVELLTFGWNAGYSEAGGVGRVARYLEGLGAIEVDIDQVSAHARLAGASKHLSNLAKVAWSKGVAALYRRERVLASTRVLATS